MSPIVPDYMPKQASPATGDAAAPLIVTQMFGERMATNHYQPQREANDIDKRIELIALYVSSRDPEIVRQHADP